MDRFIDTQLDSDNTRFWYLKSNMDRFIGMIIMCKSLSIRHLKSNMDRFIVENDIESEADNDI